MREGFAIAPPEDADVDPGGRDVNSDDITKKSSPTGGPPDPESDDTSGAGEGSVVDAPTETRSPLDPTATQRTVDPTATHRDRSLGTNDDRMDDTVTHDSVTPDAEPDDVGRTEGSRPVGELSSPDPDRYRVRDFLGAGGMGEVFAAEDSVLARDVAIKYVRDDVGGLESRRTAFIREARISGDLDHPNIPPVFDLGVDETGRTFYVMRLIQGRSLKEILASRDSDETWTVARLLALFQQACLALDFAHSRGILHLDVKPANIMIGEYGELYVVDWGLSSRVDEERRGGIRGTPTYMSPEQASGANELAPASDLFSLGTVLYEIATGCRAFGDPDSGRILERVRQANFDQGGAWLSVPSELRETVSRALAKEPGERHQSARELHDDVQLFLDGTKEKARKRKEANLSIEAAERELSERRRLLADAQKSRVEAERARPESWAPAEEKQASWDAEDGEARLSNEAEYAMERATRHMLQAFGFAPDDVEIRERLGALFWERFVEAEERADLFQLRFFESQLRRLELDEYSARLRGVGSVALSVTPSPQRVLFHRLVERNRVLCPEDEHELQPGPEIRIDEMPMGRYQITLEREGYRPLVAPVFVERDRCFEGDWRLRTDDEIGADFIQVPAGAFIMGGDAETFMSVPRCQPTVREFFIGRLPVSWRDYLEFLQSLHEKSPTLAKRRLPDLMSEGTQSWFIEDGVVQYWRSDHVKEGRRDWPIFGVSFHDAMAYCTWRSERDAIKYTLPTDEEWEKAARGVDGRLFPWGDRYDASFCKNSGSTDLKAQPEPIGTYDTDCSPYGVRDMGGTVREWCNSWFKKKDQQRLVRGGAWNFDEIGAHAAYRVGCPPAVSYPFIGFRLVHHPVD